MANHKSAAKRARMSERKRIVNSKTMSTVRTVERKLRKAIAAKSKEESVKALSEFNSVIATAAQKGRVHRSQVARKVSRLSRQVSALG